MSGQAAARTAERKDQLAQVVVLRRELVSQHVAPDRLLIEVLRRFHLHQQRRPALEAYAGQTPRSSAGVRPERWRPHGHVAGSSQSSTQGVLFSQQHLPQLRLNPCQTGSEAWSDSSWTDGLNGLAACGSTRSWDPTELVRQLNMTASVTA